MNEELPPMNNTSEPPRGEILLYAAPAGDVRVHCLLRDETIWLTQQQIADLFGVDKSGISRHLANIYDDDELNRDSVVAKIATTAADGKTYQVEYHNLDAIIAVGYRANSYQATQFRIWATRTLKEFMVKGFVLDDERLKQGKVSALNAKLKAEAEYEKFRMKQDRDYISDFDREIKRLHGGK